MTTYFKKKYRNESIRLENWYYRWDGVYFITICTANREHYFGEIIDKKMNLSNPNPNPNHPKTIGQKRFQNIGKNSISSIIGSYKSAVTKHAHRLGYEFQWQKLFYEHIIRDGQSYDNISNYIEKNVEKWKEDKFFNDNSKN